MRFVRTALFITCIGLAREPAAAQQSGRYRVDAWSTDDGLPSTFIADLAQTRDGYLWLAAGGDLVRFDGFTFRSFSPATDSALSDRVNTVYAGVGDTVWLTLDDGTIASAFQGHIARLARIARNTIGTLAQDRSGALVIVGPVSYRWEHGRFVRLSRPPDARAWISGGAPGRVYDRSRDQLLTVRRAGALAEIVDANGVVFATYRWSPVITPLLIDRTGRLWVTTGPRVFVYLPGSPDPVDRIEFHGVPSLGRAFEDREGNIWLAGVGLLRVREVPFRTIATTADTSDAGAQVMNVRPGPRGSVLAQVTQVHPALYRMDAAGTTLLRQGFARGVSDARGTTWITVDESDQPITGHPEAGRDIVIPHAGTLLLADDPARPGSVWFWLARWLYRAEPYGSGGARVTDSVRLDGQPGIAAEARDGTLWITTVDDLRRSRLTRIRGGERTSWSYGDGLPHVEIRALLPDSEGTLWLGTYGAGLVRLRGGRFAAVRARDGLAEDVVSGLLEDDAGNFWMGGNRGVHRVSRADVIAFLDGALPRVAGLSYGRADGLREPETSGGTATRAADGRLWFPTFGGAAVVDPARAIALDSVPPIVHVYDPRSPGELRPPPGTVRLALGERRLAIPFTGISLRDPAGVRLEYRMDGVDHEWVPAGDARVAVYNGVTPGGHTFHVRAMNRGGTWSAGDATLAVMVPPYFRETIAFDLLIATLLIALGWSSWRLRTRQLRLRQVELAALVEARTQELGRAMAQLETQADQLRSLDEAKSRFFANVSHEFRTPLSLVLGPIEDVRDGRAGPVPELARTRLDGVLANGRRLVQLVEQLLDIARLESGTLHLSAEVRDLVPLLRRIAESFASLAERRGLGFRVACPVGGLRVRFDPDQMEKVITNLLGNALKFTPPGGHVELRALAERDGDSGWAVVEVEDDGPGIAPEHLPRVFDRFYQVDDSPRRAHGGAGIGLALTKELVDLHGGDMRVESTPGVGSTFIVRLPLSAADERVGETVIDATPHPAVIERRGATVAAPLATRDQEEDVTTVLVAEDNAELLAYLREHLADRYRVIEAANGAQALALVRERMPDLVVSDVMMPELDGQSLCTAVKNDPETDFIPVILLTAKASRESRLAGLEGGADDYLAKPVDIRELLVRAENLITSRRRLRERYREAKRVLPSVTVPLKPGKWDPRAEALLRKLYDALAEHVGDEAFQVDALASAVGMGRSTLYRKLEELLGRSPMEVLWDYRLEQAAQWLLTTDANVSEIAYGVGFKSVPHFCAKFRERYGDTPSGYRRSSKASA